jgi:sugar diacid utilization regulator
VPETVRREEALRAEFVVDLLRGDANVARMVHRAEPFGIDLGKPHHVTLVAPLRRRGDVAGAGTALGRVVVDRAGDEMC